MAGAARIIGDTYFGGVVAPTSDGEQDLGTSDSYWGTVYALTLKGDISTSQITSGTLSVSRGGTGKSSFTANSVIMSGSSTTSSLTTRAVADSSSASAISTNNYIVTERDIYYGLPTINNGHNYTSSTTIYAPTAGGTKNQILVSAGSTATPVWKATANGAAYATSDNGELTFGTLPIAQGGTGATTAAGIRENLGLSNAMHFIGTTTTTMSDGLTTANVTVNSATHTPVAGDVVLYSDTEYVWTGSAWERLGRDSSFKTTQTAVTKPTATTNKWVSAIGQNANGVIDVSYTTLDTSGTWSGLAGKLTNLTTTDKASSTDTWRHVWFSYNDLVTGRPAYSDKLVYQTSTNTLKINDGTITATQYSGNAATATKFASTQTIALTGDTTGTASSQAGWSIATTTTKLSQSTISSLATFKDDTALIYAAAGGGNNVSDRPDGVDAFGVLSYKTAGGWYGQILISSDNSSNIYWRTNSSLSGGWLTLLDTRNYTTTLNNTYLQLAGGTLTGAINTANATWNKIGDDAQLGDINKAGHIGIKGLNSNTGIFFVTYNQSSNTTGGAITWDGSKFTITGTIDTSISGLAAKATADGSGNNIVDTYLTKAAGVTNVAYDTTNKKITQTINDTTSDVVTIAKIKTDLALAKADVGLGNVENTTLSTWAGTANITTVGTISTGTWSGTVIAADKGGTGQTSYTIGDILYASSTNALSKLGGNTTTTRKFLRSVATTSGTAVAPAWDTVTATDVGLSNVTNTAALNKNTGAKGDIIYWSAKDTPAHLTNTSSTTKNFLSITSQVPAWTTLSKSDVGLGNVENTALSTWTGSNKIATVGTITSGTWQGNDIGASYLPTATTSALGIVKIGSNISVSSGTISVATASTSALGVMKVGTGLSASSGTVSVSYGTAANTALQGNATLVTLNGTNKTAASVASFYAPTSAGTSGQYLKSSGSGAPTWANLPTLSISSSGSGNVVTDIDVSGHAITYTLGTISTVSAQIIRW